jgi:hypothetical protein
MKSKAMVMAASVVALAVLCGGAASEEGLPRDAGKLKPLDKRTRCILNFKEVLITLKYGDLKTVLTKVADGGGRDKYRVTPDGKTGDNKLDDNPAKEAIGSFISHNFPKHEAVLQQFGSIRFSDLSAEGLVVVTEKINRDKKHEGRLYRMSISIPGVEDERFRSLRFVESEGAMLWVPFGW